MFETAFSAAIFWVVVMVVMGIIEALTMGLTTIWFAGGALAACICAACGLPFIGQICVFIAVSIILLIITRPLAKKHLNSKTIDTNVDALIGMEGVAETDIAPHETGQVKADGKVWSAICEEGTIRQGDLVTIKSIKGVTLTVVGSEVPEEKEKTNA